MESSVAMFVDGVTHQLVEVLCHVYSTATKSAVI